MTSTTEDCQNCQIDTEIALHLSRDARYAVVNALVYKSNALDHVARDARYAARAAAEISSIWRMPR